MLDVGDEFIKSFFALFWIVGIFHIWKLERASEALGKKKFRGFGNHFMCKCHLRTETGGCNSCWLIYFCIKLVLERLFPQSSKNTEVIVVWEKFRVIKWWHPWCSIAYWGLQASDQKPSVPTLWLLIWACLFLLQSGDLHLFNPTNLIYNRVQCSSMWQGAAKMKNVPKGLPIQSGRQERHEQHKGKESFGLGSWKSSRFSPLSPPRPHPEQLNKAVFG